MNPTHLVVSAMNLRDTKKELIRKWNESFQFRNETAVISGIYLSKAEVQMYAPSIQTVEIRYGKRKEKLVVVNMKEETK